MYSRLYNVLSSARLAVTLFFTLAATSVIGTLLQQGLPLERYEELFGREVFSVLAFFNIFDMYHSWWFRLLIVLFSLNILACTLRQMPRMMRLLFPGKTDIDEAVFRSSQLRRTCHSREAMSDLEQRSVSLLKSLAGAPVLMTKDNVLYLFAESGRYSRSGMFLVHISILFILCGALIGALWGFSGQMNIAEGAKSDTVRLFNAKVPDKTLDFDVVCNDFNVDFYKTGMPKEYKTDLTIREDGRDVLTGSITVNHPLVYRGLKLCQATYGIADVSNFRVAV
ncbi:MAG: cytochrome c biogenesis protein ResB, partial [Deltaproteobacteria bacterium]|nr:cytochrome c biogenesis protein ResB [Deltaproteobacteria bacterium]